MYDYQIFVRKYCSLLEKEILDLFTICQMVSLFVLSTFV